MGQTFQIVARFLHYLRFAHSGRNNKGGKMNWGFGRNDGNSHETYEMGNYALTNTLQLWDLGL